MLELCTYQCAVKLTADARTSRLGWTPVEIRDTSE